MTFVRSIVIMIAVCLCIAFAYFLGHGLALHQTRPMIMGAGLLLAGAAIIAALSRDRSTSWR
jgi:uncharacterized membrane protein YadS